MIKIEKELKNLTEKLQQEREIQNNKIKENTSIIQVYNQKKKEYEEIRKEMDKLQQNFNSLESEDQKI